MSIVCKSLVLIESPEVLRMIVEAFPHPKYDLEFADNLDDAAAQVSSKGVDMFIVDSKFVGDEKVDFIRRNIPTMVVEQEYDSPSISHEDGFDLAEEAGKIKIAADDLLRKNYINWIIDALEYSS
ncbi:MAG: hypothetical protein ACLP05_13160 [Candidatus Kryptoniota bacterium]